MSNTSKIESVAKPFQDGIVKLLEQYLTEAKDGKIKGVVVVTSSIDTWSAERRGALRMTEVLGLLECAKHSFLKESLSNDPPD